MRKGPVLAALVAALVGAGIAVAFISGAAGPSHERSPGASSSDRLPSSVRALLGSRLDQISDIGCLKAPRERSGEHATVELAGPLRRLTGLRGTAALAEAPNVRCRIDLANGRTVTFVKVGGRWSRVPRGVTR